MEEAISLAAVKQKQKPDAQSSFKIQKLNNKLHYVLTNS